MKQKLVNPDDYELIEIEGQQRTHESICQSLRNKDFSPETRALDRSSESLRSYYNQKNNRRKLGHWQSESH